MQAAVMSDVHDNLENLSKFLGWCREEKIDSLICCGDLTNGETLRFLAQNFPGSVHLVRGNIELYSETETDKYENIKYYGETGIFNFEELVVGFCHEPFKIDRVIYNQAKIDKKLDFIFYGHTHKPWAEEKAGVKIFNPGTLGGVFQRPTFAVLDTDTKAVELKLLELA